LNSSEKRHRQSEKRRVHNHMIKSRVRTGVKKFLQTVQAGDKSSAETSFSTVIKLIDSAASKGVYTRNTVARTKSRLHKKLNSLAS